VDNYSKSKLTTEEQESSTQGGEQNIESKKKSIQDDIKLLIKGLNDENGLVRRSHAEALAQVG